MSNVIRLLPKELPNRMPVSIYSADPMIGGLEVVIWRNHHRDDSLIFHVANAGEAFRVLKTIGDELFAKGSA